MKRMWSKIQLIALIIATMAANIVNALKGKDIVVKTLEQTEANWTKDLNSLTLYSPTGFSVQNLFCRLQKINQELEVIFTFSITNTGASSAAPANIQCDNISIPQEIGSKIFDVLGKNLTESGSLTAIAGTPMVAYNDTPANSPVFNVSKAVLSLSHNGANNLFVAMYGFGAIAAGATATYSGRIQLTLL